MADEADRAEQEAPFFLTRSIAASKRPEGPVYTGRCAWCDEPTQPGRRFCLPELDDCQQRWERQARR